MKLIVGLGNPGTGYEKTRHNTGRRVVESFCDAHQFTAWKKKFDGLISEGRIGKEKIILLLPETYMNQSGRAVHEAADFWKIAANDIIIISDDFSLPLGTLRLRRDGSAGGHNGLKSVFEMMNTEIIPRLRIGIGSDALEQIPADKFVLEPFKPEEETLIANTINQAVDTLNLLIIEGLESAMNRFN